MAAVTIECLAQPVPVAVAIACSSQGREGHVMSPPELLCLWECRSFFMANRHCGDGSTLDHKGELAQPEPYLRFTKLLSQ